MAVYGSPLSGDAKRKIAVQVQVGCVHLFTFVRELVMREAVLAPGWRTAW